MRGRWNRTRTGGAALALCVALSGCDITEGCDPCTTSAIVHGVVTDGTGAPLVGVEVGVEAWEDACTAGFSAAGTGVEVPVTNASGAYRAEPRSIFDPFTASCLVVTVNPGGDPTWPVIVDTVDVDLDFREDPGAPRDSTRVDVTVTP